MPDLRKALRDFVATSNSGKYADEKTLLSKFPELKGYDIATLKDFVATSNSGKYATEDEIFSKFPEFNTEAVSLKKKGSLESATQQTQLQNTTGLPSADGSSGMVSQSVKDKQAIVKKKAANDEPASIQNALGLSDDSAIYKAGHWVNALMSKGTSESLKFADDLIVSARKGLQEEGFFDDDIPDTDTPLTDAMKKKVAPKKNKDGSTILTLPNAGKPQMYSDGGPLDPTPLIKGAAKLGLKIINSTLPQAQKNLIVSALNLGSSEIKSQVKLLEKYQEDKLDKSLPTKVLGGISGMVPDLVVAEAIGSPAAAEGKLTKFATEVSEGARPLIQKYLPKAAKFIEEAVKAPFTKIMAAKGTVAGVANAKEGEDVVDAAIEGGFEGAKEGVIMHGLGKVAGEVTPKIAKIISKTGLDSKFATAIANPLANAGVFSTAKAIRTPIETGEFATAEELALEAGAGVGFSLLHAGSLYKNHNEANHYYDNVLKTDPLESFGRVINETKDNLELVYNPDLTPTKIIELESARDQLKKAIIKEPDLNNKKLLGDEALKIQNQLDANSAIKGIVENKDAIIEAINTNENLSEEVKSQKTKKVAAIADFFDKSEFGLKKKELDTKINDAQKSLDDASLGFTNLKKASDRVQAKIEIEKRRQEVEDLNNELTDLITNKLNEKPAQEQPVEQPEGVTAEKEIADAKPQEVEIPDWYREEYDSNIIEYDKDISDAKKDLEAEKAKGFFSRDKKWIKYYEDTLKFYEDKAKLLKENPIEFYKSELKGVKENHEERLDEDPEYKQQLIDNYGTTDFEVTASNFIEDTNRKISDYEAVQKTANENAQNVANETSVSKTPIAETKTETAPVEALKDIESTTKALINDIVLKDNFDGSENQKKFFKANDLVPDGIYSETISKSPSEAIAEAYHKAKEENNNPELVKAVEELLAPKVDEVVTEEVKPTETKVEITTTEVAPTEPMIEEVVTPEITTQGLSEAELPGYDRMITEAEAITKEKRRGRKLAEMHDAVMGYVTGSKVYEDATDVQRERLVRDVRKRFGLKEKSAPSVAKLFGKLKDVTKITMDEMKLIHNDIKMQNLGAKQVIETLNKKKAELTEATDELVRQGKITTQQASNVVKRFAKVNLLSETSVNRFTEYMAKVFNKADYAKKLTDGKVFKKDISKLSKNKNKNVNLTELGKKFAKIDPSMVENIDEYNSIAAQVKEAIKGSTKRLEKINWAGTVKIEDVAKYIDKTIEAQDLKLREEKIAELQDLMGVDASKFSAEEIDELLKTDKRMNDKDSAIAKATIKKGFNIYSTMIKEAIETGKDPFTGEDVSYKPKDKKIIEAFMNIELNRLTDKQALAAADALHNFLVNKSTANMEDVLAKYQGVLNAEEFLTTGGKNGKGRVAIALRKYFSKDAGRFITQKGTPMGDVFTKLFKGTEAGSEFGRLSGFNKITKGKMTAIMITENISKEYIEKFFDKKANGEKFNTSYNEAERGIVSDLRRSTLGNEVTEFKRRVGILDQSIKELEKGTPEEVKKAELYQKVYDKVVEGSKDLSDVESKTDKNNLSAIKFWQNQHELYFDDLANYMLNVHNTILEKGINYASPDRYAKLSEETPAKLLDNEAMYGAGGEHLYKKEASGLMKAQYPKDLPQGRYRDYSFDKNNVNSMRDALVDMNTGGAIRQLEAFRESAEYKKIIPSIFDRNMVNKRMTDYVANTRNKGNSGSEDYTNIMKLLDKTATIGASMVLGSPLQAIQQTIPIVSNTIINSGKIGFMGAFDPNFGHFLDTSGYATGHRGVESQLEISSLNKKIELAAEGNTAQLAQAIQNASKFWLKTFLVKPDVFIARSSWKSYYEQSLERQGISTKGIDYSTHKLNEKAGDYAELMVSRQQNVSDHDLAGEWFTKNTPDAKILKKIFLNMASFRMNQSARLGADLTTIGHWSVSTTADKITAARSLAGYAAEMVTFRLLSAAAIIGTGTLAKKIKGEDESDEEFDKRLANVLKGQLTSSVVDTFSPAPFLDTVVKVVLSPASEKLEEITGLPLSIYGATKVEDWLQQLGAYGMAPQRLYDIGVAAYLGFTGTYKDDYGNIKKISEEDQETIKELLPFYAATGFGLLPTDVAKGIKNVIKYSKTKGKTPEEVAKGIEELRRIRKMIREARNPEEKAAAKKLLIKKLEPDTYSEEADNLKVLKEKLLKDKENDRVYDNEEDLKKYNPNLWNKNFGEGSEWYEKTNADKKAAKLESQLETEVKDEEYGYIEGRKKKRKKNKDGSKKSYRRSYSRRSYD